MGFKVNPLKVFPVQQEERKLRNDIQSEARKGTKPGVILTASSLENITRSREDVKERS